MDLPTYTNIWRIERRLYKLYDFRLPMPLPISQIAVFLAIAVPYVVLLTVLGLPFNHTLIWLYLLPPGLLTWLVTRPVLEGKRLPELVGSQVRYLAEPRVWCRMAPLAEKDVIVLTGRVWRSGAAGRPATAEPEPEPEPEREREAHRWPVGLRPPQPAELARSAGPQPSRPVSPQLARSAGPQLSRPVSSQLSQPAGPQLSGTGAQPRSWSAARPTARPASQGSALASGWSAATGPAPERLTASGQSSSGQSSSGPAASGQPASGPAAPNPAGARGPASQRPVVTVVNEGSGTATPPAVERALAGPSANRGDARHGRVLVVPGGHRPGKPDQLQRDRSRAQLPISGPSRIVVLGCTVGAGQTITTLLAGEVLASLRADHVAVLDLNPGASSLTRRAQARPALSQAASLGPSRLEVLARTPGYGPGEAGESSPGDGPANDARMLELASARYSLVLADPSTSAVPRLLAIADQLVLVAPASAAAAGAIAMTFEWLDAHGQASLSAAAIMVMNGVSRRTMVQVEQAERVATGRCRAIVRVPWDDQLQNPAARRTRPTAPGSAAHQHWAGLLSQATVGAYTALAGVLVAALADEAAR